MNMNMKDVEAFIAALRNHLTALVASGLLAVALVALPAWGVPVPASLIRAAIVLCLLGAAFGAWRDERRAGETLTAGLAEAKSEIRRLKDKEEPDPVAPEVSNLEYWFLTAVAQFTLRIESAPDRYGSTASLLFLGETPIDAKESPWFYSTAKGLRTRGLLGTTGGIHKLSDEARDALRLGKKKGRRIQMPADPLVNGRDGSPVTLLLS